MRTWLHHHRVAGTLIASAFAVAVAEGFLVLYYLNSWLTLTY